MGIKYYQKIIPCFQKDITPIFKISKNKSDGSSTFVGACLSHNFKKMISRSQSFEIPKLKNTSPKSHPFKNKVSQNFRIINNGNLKNVGTHSFQKQ